MVSFIYFLFRLTHLEIKRHCGENIFGMDRVFQQLPLLKSLNYTAYHFGEEHRLREDDGTFEELEGYYENEDTEATVNLSSIQPQEGIEEFIGSFIYCNDDAYKYFMHDCSWLKCLKKSTS